MDFTELMRLAGGHVEARLIQTAVELAIFDALENSAATFEAVANRLELEPKATELLLNALASLELLDKRGGSFSLTESAAKYLLKSSPQYVGGMIRFESLLWSCWEKLPEAIRSGRPARPPNMYQDNPAETEIFIKAMDSLVNARGDAAVAANATDWSGIAELLDVGSGPATYPIAFCKRFPGLRVTIFDLPGTLAITDKICSGSGDDRTNPARSPATIGQTPIPGSYDVIFLSNIIHGESFENNRSLIRKLVSNLKPGGQIVIKDHILDDSRTTPPVGAIFSLLMLLTTESGRCYSFNEIRSWMEQAGLSQVRQIDLPPPLTSSLVVGTR